VRLLTSLIAIFLTTAALAQSVEEKISACNGCHGDQGRSIQPRTPSLGGQPELFVQIELFLFRQRQRMRNESPMNEYVKDLSDPDLQALAAHIAKLPPPKQVEGNLDRAKLERGRMLAMQNRCGFCHNADFSGRDQMPRLAGQREDYLVKALRDYKSGARLGYDPMMQQVVYSVTDQEMQDLAYFMSRFPGLSAGEAKTGGSATPREIR